MNEARKSKSVPIYLPRKLHRKRLHTTNYFIYYLNKFSFNYSPESIRIQTRMCVYLKFRFILQLNRSVFGERVCVQIRFLGYLCYMV